MKKLILCILVAMPASVFPDAQPQTATAAKPRGRALLVGVNAYQVKGINPTPGAIEDALAIGKLIQEKGWFAPQEIKTLTGEQATAANIEREFREWLIRGTSPGDRVFFLYSGHGTQTPDDDGDERRSDPTDDKDEVIAPYDVNVSGRRLVNIIRDDQFNDWLGSLGGRSVVMVFDSCNSGTVSRGDRIGGSGAERLGPRYLPTPEQWQWDAQTRSMTDGGAYVVSDGPRSRLLEQVVDKDRLAPNSALAIFSATKSYQLAWPMRTPQGLRGAFSYFIEQALRAGNPALRELFQAVADNIKRAQQASLLVGQQEPDIEVSAPSLMDDHPLFAAAAAPAQLPLLAPGFTNASSKLSVTARLGYLKDGVFQTDRKVFCFGEEIGYRIHTGSPGYLYLIAFSRHDVVTLFYPGKGEQEYFEAGDHSLNGFPVQAPEGKDVIVALLTRDKLALKEYADARPEGDPPLTWKQVFALLGSPELEQTVRTRGQDVRLRGKTLADADWQAVVLSSEAVKSCGQLRRQ
jgi:caspase domain-containing protein